MLRKYAIRHAQVSTECVDGSANPQRHAVVARRPFFEVSRRPVVVSEMAPPSARRPAQSVGCVSVRIVEWTSIRWIQQPDAADDIATSPDRQRARLSTLVAITVALLATFLGVFKVKDDNIGQAMEQVTCPQDPLHG
jgi:hypothetical protein